MLKSLSTSLIVRGVLAVAVGIMALAWPSVTVLALVILFAVSGFLASGLQARRAFGGRKAGPVFGHLLLGLLDLAAVGQGTRLLEIGTGWGELAVRAARRGAVVHTVTNMAEHADVAAARISAAGLTESIRVQVADYREIAAEPASFDAIVSVEMVEAVGRQYWSSYFQTLDNLLADHGRIGLQTMCMPHDRMLRTSNTFTWTDKYVFPGGLLPSIEAIEQHMASDTALRITDRFSFGAHYAATLRLWRERFNQNWAQVAELGFDQVFRRTWNLYLGMSEAGFAAGHLDVHQLLLER